MSWENEPTLITVGEAAKLLAVKESRIRTAVFRREVRFVKIGRLVRFRKEDLFRWVESRTVQVSEMGTKWE